jgi:hypothetical protein
LEYPVFLMIRDLLQRGWKFEVGFVGPHLVDSPKLLNSDFPVKRKNYLRAVLSLDELRGLGLVELHVGQLDAYYRLVLYGDDKATILPGLPATTYQLMLKDVEMPLALAADDAAEIELALALAVEGAPPTPAAAPLALEGPPSIDDDDMPSEHLGGQVVEVPSAAIVPPVDVSAAIEDDASDSDSTLTDLEVVPVLLADGVDDDMPQPNLRGNVFASHENAVDPVTITHIHGLLMTLDDYEPRGYVRLGVSCPFRHGTHYHAGRECHRWRGLGPAQTSRRGRLETIGFLGAWVARALSTTDKFTHQKFQPSHEDIDAWLFAQGYIRPP